MKLWTVAVSDYVYVVTVCQDLITTHVTGVRGARSDIQSYKISCILRGAGTWKVCLVLFPSLRVM